MSRLIASFLGLFLFLGSNSAIGRYFRSQLQVSAAEVRDMVSFENCNIEELAAAEELMLRLISETVK